MRATRRTVLVALLLLTTVPAAARAQEPAGGAVIPPDRVERVGRSDVALDRRLGALLSGATRPARTTLVLAGDTLIAAGDTVARSVLVLDATLILEGVVSGDLVLVDAGAFIRPGARVDGDLVNIAGGLYRSELASVGGAIVDLPTADYRVMREAARVVIEATDAVDRVRLDGLGGFHLPTYDRVNGVTAVWGARLRLPHLGLVQPSLHGQVGWQTQRGEPTYGASVEVRRESRAVELGYDRGWATNERWIATDLSNSLNYLWDGDDFRDYHDAERLWVGARQTLSDEEKAFHGVAFVRGQVEDATTLPGGEPWHLLGDSARSNPPVDDGRTTSVIVGFDVRWHGSHTWFEGGVEYEAGREWIDGEASFDRIAVVGDWAMQALADHTLEIEFFVQQPLGGARLPRQRWSYVGGSRTLQTVAFARYTGGRVVFVETRYIIPLPDRVRLPLLGAPDLELIHGTGMAWTEGDDPPFEQELGLRLSFFGLEFRYMVDPEDLDTGDLDIGINASFGGEYPWQQ